MEEFIADVNTGMLSLRSNMFTVMVVIVSSCSAVNAI